MYFLNKKNQLICIVYRNIKVEIINDYVLLCDNCVYFQIVILLESLEEEGDIILDVYFFLVRFVDGQYQYIVNYMKFSIFEVK